jgi:hypothetical protein
MATDDINEMLIPMFEEDARLVGQARGLTDVFVAAAGEHVADWIGEHVRKIVTIEHEVTAAIGPKLTDLKGALAKVQATAPAKTKAVLKDLGWLWTRGRDEPLRTTGSYPPVATSPFHIYDDTFGNSLTVPRLIQESLSVAYGDAGPLLKRYGYKDAENFVPLKHQTTGNRYRYGADLSEAGKRALKAAADADDLIGRHRQAIQKRRKELHEAAATSAWDSA